MITHFVGFRGDEFNRAIKVFGPPHMIHHDWDRRAESEIEPCDLVVFANDKDWNRFQNNYYAPFSFSEDF